MKYLLCAMLAIISLSLWGAWEWAHTIGGDNMERTWDITCDPVGNIFIAGEFEGALIIDGQNLPGFGLSDSFVAKYSPTGDLLWAMPFGSTDEDVALGVGSDALGNCYVGGYFIGTFTCQGQSVNSYGMWDAYIVKFDPSGNLSWLRSFGGPLNDIGHGLAVNSEGKVFIAGWFADTIKFPGGNTIVSAGGSDVYCSAWDTNGNFLWARSAGTPGVEYGYKVACDDSGAAYVTGVAGLGTMFGSFQLDSDGVFVAKYNAQGQEQWLAATNTPFVISISVQGTNNGSQYGMICGRIMGYGQIGAFEYNSNSGSEDAYWAQFDAISGQWTFMEYYGGALADKGRDCDYEAYPAFVASYEDTGMFGAITYTSLGESDLVMGFGALDGLQWNATGGENSEVPFGIKILPNGKLAVCGWHYGNGYMGYHPIVTGNVSNQNAFVACYNPATEVQDELLPSPCSLVAFPNPFVSELKIIASHGDTCAEVYNLKGQKVRTLQATSLGKNKTEYLWDGYNDLGVRQSAGVYLVKTQAGVIKTLKL